MKKVLFLLIVCLHVNLNGQKINKDSLLMALKGKNDEQRINIMHSLVKYYSSNNLDSAYYYSSKSLEISKVSKNKVLEGKSLYLLGKLYKTSGKILNSRKIQNEAIEIYNNINYKEGIGECLNEIGNSYKSESKYDSAKYYYLQSIQFAKESNDSTSEAGIKINLGIVEDYSGNYDKAIAYYLDAEKYFSKVKDYTTLGMINLNIAFVQIMMKNMDKALEYMQKAKKLYSLNNNYLEIFRVNSGIHQIYIEKNRLDLAKEYLEDNDKILNGINSPELIMEHYSAWGNYYVIEKNFIKAVEYLDRSMLIAKRLNSLSSYYQIFSNKGTIELQRGNYYDAIKIFNEILVQKHKIQDKLFINTTQKNLADAYYATKQFNKSSTIYKEYISLRDSIYKDSEISKANELEAKYQNKEKESENKQLKADKDLQAARIDFQRKSLIGTIASLLAVSLLSFFLYDQSKKRKKASLALEQQNKEIQLLNSELNHRVKNNLAFMTSLLEMQGRRTDSSEIKEALKESESRLNALSLIHRNLMKNSLGKEVNLKDYLEEVVGKLKEIFETPNLPLEVSLTVDSINMDAEKAMRVGLMINELFTNSVKHAFEGILKPKIEIFALHHAKGLELKYKDNGGYHENIFANEDGISSNQGNLGSKLLNLLAKQMQGSIVPNEQYFQVDFPLP